jgi:hypothetical protein
VEPWTSRTPDPVPESSGRRWLVLFGGGLLLLLALWFSLSWFQKANAPSTEPQTLHPYIKPPVGGYESARQGLTEICLTRSPQNKEFCTIAEGILQATEQHKCSDAKVLRERLDGYYVARDLTPGQGATQKLASFKEKLDQEIARCWKFWNP